MTLHSLGLLAPTPPPVSVRYGSAFARVPEPSPLRILPAPGSPWPLCIEADPKLAYALRTRETEHALRRAWSARLAARAAEREAREKR